VLKVVKAPPDFVFRVVSGAVVYTAISVINALRVSVRTTSSFISVSPISPVPGLQYHVHTGTLKWKLHVTIIEFSLAI